MGYNRMDASPILIYLHVDINCLVALVHCQILAGQYFEMIFCSKLLDLITFNLVPSLFCIT